MKLKNISKEDLELMPFDDIAYLILKEKGKKMKITDLFKMICDMLDLGEKAYLDQIGDFFTLLSTERRFIQLDKGFWDLRVNHTTKIDINSYNDLSDEDEVIIEEDMEEEEEEEFDESKDIEDDTGEDDYKDFVIIDEDMEDESL